MITPEEFERQWKSNPHVIECGDTELVRATPEAVAPLDIPEDAKYWLTEVGLPKDIDAILDSDSLAVGVPPLSDLLEDGSDFNIDVQRMYILANYDNDWLVCIDGQGKIWRVHLNYHVSLPEQFIVFLNSSLHQLAESLLSHRRFLSKYGVIRAKYQPLREQIRSRNEDDTELENAWYWEREQAWDEWQADLTEIDPAAMEQDACWFKEVNYFII